jgi:hypothetical protein
MLYILLSEKKKEEEEGERKREKKRGKNGQGAFSQDRHTLWAVPCWDFPDC